MIVGTAGHVDHGKTSLVRALTGVDTDRLKEEKARGITIDLGFAYLSEAGGPTIGFVDVPGHEKLVRTMVAGASGIDFALLVVAADDGPMPQTREHLDILDLLDLKRGLIAVTKSDRIDGPRREAVAREIRAAVDGSTFAGADMIFVSSQNGSGIDTLRARLTVEANRTSANAEAHGAFRLAVDRAFSLSGIGTVATGTVMAGSIAVGDEVSVLPAGRRARVRSIHAQNVKADEGRAGERCALALSGIDKDGVARGSWICGGAAPAQSTRLDVEITLLPSASRPLSEWTPVHFHCGASDVGARVTVLASEPVVPGERGFAQILLGGPLPLRNGDRFVLRDQSARSTIGGGIVLDPRASIRKRKSADRLARLDCARERDMATALSKTLGLEPGFEDIDAFAGDRGSTVDAIDMAALDLEHLRSAGVHYVCRRDRWVEVAYALTSALETFHETQPDLPGLAGERLRLTLRPALSRPLFAAIRDRLVHEKRIAVQGHWLRLPRHVARLSLEDSALARAMIPLIEANRFRPPRVRDIAGAVSAPEATTRRACKSLARTGALVEVAHDQFFLRETVVEMAGIAQHLTRTSATGQFTAADFRDRMDNGRKVAIQILDYFDRNGLTHRQGDLRRVVKAPDLIFGEAPVEDSRT